MDAIYIEFRYMYNKMSAQWARGNTSPQNHFGAEIKKPALPQFKKYISRIEKLDPLYL
jgi:hypothetical protein